MEVPISRISQPTTLKVSKSFTVTVSISYLVWRYNPKRTENPMMVIPIQIYMPNRDGGIGVVGFASKSGGIRVFRNGKAKAIKHLLRATGSRHRPSLTFLFGSGQTDRSSLNRSLACIREFTAQ